MANHIIHRQQVVLKVAQGSAAPALQEAVSRMLHNGLPARLETVLDEMVPPNQIVRIDTLQLDLGTIAGDDFEQVFKERLIAALKQAVTEEKGKAGSTAVFNRQQSLTAAFIYFLEYGTLPWHKTQTDKVAWEVEMIELFSPADWQQVRHWLLGKEGARSATWCRLSSQFSDTLLRHMAALVPNLFSHSEWKEVYTALLQAGSRLASPAAVRHQLWATAITLSPQEESKTVVVQQIIKALSTGLRVPLREIISATETEALQSPLVQEARIILLKKEVGIQTENPFPTNNILVSTLPPIHRESQLPDAANTVHNDGSPQQDTANQTAPKLTGQHNPVSKNIISSKPEAVQYVTSCGIVLLHPFLERYLTELELVQQKAFADEASRQRAVLLLHYLATGEAEEAEFNLVLQKKLCGLPPEETLPAQIKLTEKEKQESGQLLQSVINYWPPLKNTSPEGLRHTFLQRQGRLEARENGSLLTVEQKTVDILLNQLPWGFSTIRLPWMNSILNVEWV